MKDKFLDSIENKNEKRFWVKALEVSSKKGLTTAMVRRGTKLFGKNKLTVKSVKSLGMQILEHFKELVVILLCVAAILSIILGIITAVQHPSDVIEYVSLFIESVIIAGIVFTNIFLSIRQADKTDKALQALKDLAVPMAKVLRNGRVKLIPSVNIVPGDILILEAGEAVPADAKLIQASDLKIDESVLTGESNEVLKDPKFRSNEKMSIGDRKDFVFSGTSVLNGSGVAQVRYIGMNTQVGKIAKLLDQEKAELTPLQKQIAKLSKIVGIVAISVCLVTFILYLVAMTGYNGFNIAGWGDALNVSISLAIASIPETLLAVVSIILSISVQRMSKQNALIKRLPAIETLGATSVVCTDKTGTLTKNVMTVVKTWSTKFPLQLPDAKKPNDPNIALYKYGSLCNDTKVLKERSRVKYIGDPTETAIVKGYVNQGQDFEKLIARNKRYAEIPFDSERKMMSVIVPSDKRDHKYMLIVKGAPDKIFRRLENSRDNQLAKARLVNEHFGNNALRVLAVAVRYFDEIPANLKTANVESKLKLIGLIGIMDPPKVEAKISVKELREAGIRTVMITGDHKTTAAAIAKDLNILQPGQEVISGTELDKMTDKQLAKNVTKYSVYARVSPSDKLRIVKAWKANGQIVSMTGDGVNDAPSLKAADIGCAMGITGTDVAKDASSMVLIDDNFSTIVRAIDMGRKVMLNIKSSLSLLLTANLANFLVVFVGILLFFISPMRSLQILFINIALETLLSFAIARNVREEKVMRFYPRDPKKFIIDKKMFGEILFFGIIVSVMSLAMFYLGTCCGAPYNFNLLRFWADASAYKQGHFIVDQATNIQYINQTMFVGMNIGYTPTTDFLNAYSYGSLLCFMTQTLCLSLNGFYARTSGSIFVQKWSNSRWMLLSVAASILISAFVAFVPYVNRIFNMNIYGTKYIAIAHMFANGQMEFLNWYLYLPLAAALFFIIISEIYRLFARIFYNSDGSSKKATNLIVKKQKVVAWPDERKSEKEFLEKLTKASRYVSNLPTLEKEKEPAPVAKVKQPVEVKVEKEPAKPTKKTNMVSKDMLAPSKPLELMTPEERKAEEIRLRRLKNRFTKSGMRIEDIINETRKEVDKIDKNQKK